MNVYTCVDHAGHWPVGVGSVVIAANEDDARHLLDMALRARGLYDGKPYTLWQLPIDRPSVRVLRDGNY